MRFEDPIASYSQERNDDLKQELEEIQKKIDRVNSALCSDALQVSDKLQLEEDLRKYEGQKQELHARHNENLSAVIGGVDESSKKFAFQPRDVVQDQINVKSEEKNQMEEKKQTSDPVVQLEEQQVKKTEDVLVQDPEAAAMGGFDDKTMSYVQKKEQNNDANLKREIDEEEKFDREVARRAGMTASVEGDRARKETFDTDLYEEEKFDREVASGNRNGTERVFNVDIELRHKKEKEKREQERLMRLAEAQKSLDNIREMLAVKKRRGETAMNKIRSLLGLSLLGGSQYDKDIAILEEEYQKAQRNYNEVLSEGADQMDESQQKKINEEMRFLSFKESQAMYDAEVKARLETFAGSVGHEIHKAGLWYRELPKVKKLAMAAAILGVGVLTGGAGFAGGAVGAAAVARRFFGAAAAGVGVGMALETRVTAKRKQEHQTERETFAALTLEQQKVILAQMDGETMDRYHKMQTSRRRVKLASIAAAAAVLVGGKAVSAATHAFDGEAVTQKISGVAEKMGQKSLDLGGDMSGGGEAMMAESAKESMVNKTEVVGGGISTEWFNAHTSFDETVADFEKRGFEDTKTFDAFKKLHGKEAFEKFLTDHKELSQDEAMKRWDTIMIRHADSFGARMVSERKIEVVHGLAKKMGLDVENLKVTLKGGVPVEINGQKVPVELLTDEQKKSVAVAEKFSAMMSGESEVSKGPGKILESMKVDTRPYDSDYGIKPSSAPMPTPEQAEFAFAGDAPDYHVSKPLTDTSIPAPEQVEAVSVKDVSDHTFAQLKGISIDQNAGTGKLVVEKNSNYIKTLAAFLEKNAEGMIDGKMGWDPVKYKDAHEWALKRATGIAREYSLAHKNIDLNMVQPGTEITVDLKNLSNIKTNVNFADGPRIIPDGVKVDMGRVAQEVQEKVTHAASEGIVDGGYVQRYAKELARGFGMTEQMYQVTKDMPARDFVATIAQEKNPSLFKKEFLEYTQKNPELLNQEAGRVLEEYYREVHDVPHMESPTSQYEQHLAPDADQRPENAQTIAEKMGSPEFRQEMALQTRKVFGANIANIHNARVQFLAEHRPDIMRKLTAIGERSGITYSNDTKVSTYMARVVAKGVRYEDLGVS